MRRGPTKQGLGLDLVVEPPGALLLVHKQMTTASDTRYYVSFPVK